MHPLKKWRLLADLSKVELGAAVERSDVAVGRWEAGAIPDKEAMQALINFTKGAVTPNDWFIIPGDTAPANRGKPNGTASQGRGRQAQGKENTKTQGRKSSQARR